MTQIMFEVFNVPCLFVQQQAVLAMYSSGRTTGLVLDSGEGVSNSMSIYEGYSIPNSIERIELAGSHITKYLQGLLKGKNKNLSTEAGLETVKDIKEKLCFVAQQDFDIAMKQSVHDGSVEKAYDLPDKTTITVEDQRFQCPEILFQPGHAGYEMSGVHKYVYDSIIN
mmetsp:Transcript_3807/g.3553  ORF Transcript_3807/g.3553 Transcript_3807/m.3553 type:complete len:168 (+) Transcript_3807:346-849(+)|eukprot:CAMPEP_0197000400 /NCGR_PEP_ID=MMETSP1380-20130617/5355_1 /TAXON_ID=5936 /ORGANISM="Euplotes crassus, Strain CT5" /LENGTH=167 /DNA_ID=CAMNT_0042417681 /DNA_START=339 /DNA_END=842 /DNA_ORIENTATION=+